MILVYTLKVTPELPALVALVLVPHQFPVQSFHFLLLIFASFPELLCQGGALGSAAAPSPFTSSV